MDQAYTSNQQASARQCGPVVLQEYWLSGIVVVAALAASAAGCWRARSRSSVGGPAQPPTPAGNRIGLGIEVPPGVLSIADEMIE